MAITYNINKGVNKSIELKGLKAQYIMYLAGGCIGLLLFFCIAYIAGMPTLICLGITLAGGFALFTTVFRLSKKYGEHGLMKASANRNLPFAVTCKTRRLFIDLNKGGNN